MVAEKLADIAPVIQKAQESVKVIQKNHLEEMKSMMKPPVGVRLTMEAVFMVLGQGKVEWNFVRKAVQDKGFTDSVLKFDADTIKSKVGPASPPLVVEIDACTLL